MLRVGRARKLPRREVYADQAASLRALARNPNELAPHLINEDLLDASELEDEIIGRSFHEFGDDGEVRELIVCAVVQRREGKKIAFINAEDEGKLELNLGKLARGKLDESDFNEVVEFMFDEFRSSLYALDEKTRLEVLQSHPHLPLGEVASSLQNDDFAVRLSTIEPVWLKEATAAAKSIDAHFKKRPEQLCAYLSEQMVLVQIIGEDINNQLKFCIDRHRDVDEDEVTLRRTDWRWLSPASLKLLETLLSVCGFKTASGVGGVKKMVALNGEAVVRFISHASSIYSHNFLRKIR